MSVIQYAVEIESSDPAYTYRWITNRPGYTGSPTYPTWENGSDNVYAWSEGIITKDGIGTSTRSTDITLTGGYSTASSLSIVISNTTKIWKTFETVGVSFINRAIRMYTVIDDVFYATWQDVITDTPRTETTMTFICNSGFKSVHSSIPPDSLSLTNYEDAPESYQNESVPVVIGDVPYAALRLTEGNLEYQDLFETYRGDISKVCSGSKLSYAIFNGQEIKLNLLLPGGIDIEEDQFAGLYLFRIGDNKGIRILSNSAKQNNSYLGGIVSVVLSEVFSEGDSKIPRIDVDTQYLYDRPYYSGYATSETWWFKIAKLDIKALLSSGEVYDIVTDSSGLPNLFYYSQDNEQYYPINYVTIDYDEGSSTEAASVTFNEGTISESGEFETLFPVVPSITTMYSGSTDGVFSIDSALDTSVLTDKDRTTYLQYSVKSNVLDSVYIEFEVDAHQIISDEVSNIFFGADFTTSDLTPNPEFGIVFESSVVLTDIYGNTIELSEEPEDTTYPKTFNFNSSIPFLLTPNFLPNEYYVGGGDNDEVSFWGDAKFSLCKLTDEAKDYIKNDIASSNIRIRYTIRRDYVSAAFPLSTGFTVKVKQFGFIGYENVNIEGNVFVRASGELDPDNNNANTVYKAFRLMLEEYDGINLSDIDYDNLPTVRDSGWHVGRQIVDKKNSFEYLKELASHSFVSIYRTREGILKLTAWREKDTADYTHDETVIIRDSIKNFVKTSINKIYNNFKIEYSYNPGNGKYDRMFTIDKVNKPAFPDITEDWSSYFSGLENGSYATSKYMWELCNESYEFVATISSLMPNNISKLPWYIDTRIFDAAASTGYGIDSSAFKYLENCVLWVTKQKYTVSYEIPINSTNINIELLDRIDFSDSIYTDSEIYTGWVTNIAIKTKENTIGLQLMLDPKDGDIIANLIEERGTPLNDDALIEESGSLPDTIEEQGV